MKFAIAPGSVSIAKRLTFGDRDARALHICKVALEALFDDVRTLVKDGVKRDVFRRIHAATTERKKAALVLRGNSRMNALKRWLDEEYPLGYSRGNSAASRNETFTSLLHAISHTDAAAAAGLGDYKNEDTSPTSFAASLYRMSFQPRPAQPVAPVLQTGCFLPVLLVAHEQLLSIFDSNVPGAEESFVKSSFVAAIKHMKIHFYPSPLPKKPGSSGAPNRKPVFNSWTFLARMDGPPANSIAGPSSSGLLPPIPPETVAFENAIANDSNAPWSSLDKELNTLHTILNKAFLPQDYKPSRSPQFPYVDATYIWVQEKYCAYKAVHHLALIVGIIAAKYFLPNLFYPAKKNHLFPLGINRYQVDKVYADLEWVAKGKNKGKTEQAIFIGMFTTFIIALYEEKSPLRVEMAKKRHGGLGEGWTNKHSQSPSSLLSPLSLGRLLTSFLSFLTLQPSRA